MKAFHSYGPVDHDAHYCVNRTELIEQCVQQLLGEKPEKGGHYFTIWAPRQTGKTWLIQQSIKKIQKQCGDKYIIGNLSMQGLKFDDDDPADEFLIEIPGIISQKFRIEIDPLKRWTDFQNLFNKEKGIFDKPLILLIDEFDKLPKHFIDAIVNTFRDIYLYRNDYMLHGLALVGVRAVLGVDSKQGSPFNVQRSLNVPNLSFDETLEMFNQYQEESGQKIEKGVIENLYELTNGQPGLIGWLGELLTDTYKYNPGYETTIDIPIWNRVKRKALFKEPNNTLINLIAKARDLEYSGFVIDLFSNSHITFSFHDPTQNYLYMNGIIDAHETEDGELVRFSSPFVQRCLFHALGRDALKQARLDIHNIKLLAIPPLDTLDDVFSGQELNLPPLLNRYIDYLARLKEKGITPWKDQPRRQSDFHYTEAVGHFHLYHWLQMALGRRCSIIPEFPTGNGKVDLHLICGEKKGLIEVKSFTNAYDAREARKQAAKYAKKTKHTDVTVAMFAPFSDEDILQQMSVKEKIHGVDVTVVAIGQD